MRFDHFSRYGSVTSIVDHDPSGLITRMHSNAMQYGMSLITLCLQEISKFDPIHQNQNHGTDEDQTWHASHTLSGSAPVPRLVLWSRDLWHSTRIRNAFSWNPGWRQVPS
jgi:hypothetical protein